MFESLRTHLKFQLEFYLTKLIDIIVSDSGKISYEHKEIALDNILTLWRIPGLVTELYLNYDCNMYCTNLYEDLTKLLAKNAFSATSGVYHTHMLSLDALLTVIESIEEHCLEGKEAVELPKKNEQEVESIDNFIGAKNARQKVSEHIPGKDELMACKTMKKVIWVKLATLSVKTLTFSVPPLNTQCKVGNTFCQIKSAYLDNCFFFLIMRNVFSGCPWARSTSTTSRKRGCSSCKSTEC